MKPREQAPDGTVVEIAAGEELVRYLEGVSKPLSSGDVSLTVRDKRVGIERKEWSNLVSSYRNGELIDQLRRMCEEYDTVILLIEGTPYSTYKGRCYVPGYGEVAVSYAQLMCDLEVYQAELGIDVVITTSLKGTARFVVKLAEALLSEDVSALTRVKRPPKVDKRLAGLLWMPGVGETLAKRLLARYGTVGAVLAAALGGGVTVDGFGPERNRQLKEALDATD